MKSTAKIAHISGNAFSIAGMVYSSISYAHIDNPTWGDKAALGVSYVSGGLSIFTPTSALGVGIGLFDMAGGFDGFYDYLDNNEQLYNTSGGIIAPIGLNGMPVYVQLK